MADDGFSPEMLDAYFAAHARQSDGGSGGGPRTPWTADYIQANAPAFLQALVEAGIDPNLTPDEVMTPGLREQVLMAEGRERARPRYQQALDRAQKHGYQQLASRIENLVEADAQRHARRGLRRSGGIGSDVVAAPSAQTPSRSAAPPLPVGGTSGPMPMMRPASGAASPLPSDGAVAPPLPVPGSFNPMPAMTLTGRENAPQAPILPTGIDYGRPAPRMPSISQIPRNLLAEAAGDTGGTPLGAAVGGAMPQSRDEAADLDAGVRWGRAVGEMSGAAPLRRSGLALSEGRLLDAAGNAAAAATPFVAPVAGPAIGAGMRAVGRAGAEVGRAAVSRPTIPNLLASAAIGGGITAASTGNTQEVEIPKEFRPMDREEYFRRNRASRRTLADLQTEAERAVTSNPAYQGLIEDRQTTRADRMIAQARANAKKTFDEQEASLKGEDDRLEQAYDKYKAGLKTDLDAYFSVRAGEQQAARDRLANTPFRQRYPELSGALPYVGMGIAAGVPFAGRSIANAMTWLPRSASRQFDAATARAEGAANMRDFNTAAGEIRNSLAARPQSVFDQPTRGAATRTAAKNLTPHITSGAAGGGLVAEANMFPYQWDALNLPPGEAQREARANALDIVQYGERGLMGSLAGASGYKGANILIPRRQPNWARGEAAANNPPGGGGGGRGQGNNQPPPLPLPSLVERKARANPDDPRGDWVPRTEPAARGVTSYVSREGRNEVFLDAGGNWQRRLPNGQTQFLDSRASRALDAGRPPPKYRRISQAEPNLLAQYG